MTRLLGSGTESFPLRRWLLGGCLVLCAVGCSPREEVSGPNPEAPVDQVESTTVDPAAAPVDAATEPDPGNTERAAGDENPSDTGAQVGATDPSTRDADPSAEPNANPPGTASEDVAQTSSGSGTPSGAGLDPAPRPSGSASEPDGSTPEPGVPQRPTNPMEQAAATAFPAPEGATRLAKTANLWIDREAGRVILDGYVTLREGPLEMFACPAGTKEHESIVAVLSAARYVHAGLLAIGAQQGTPVAFVPEYRPATGQRIAVWVMWRDTEGMIQKQPAQQWIQKTGTDEILQQDWVFAGSSFWTDPSTGTEYYQADSGDLICVSNFATAMMDLPVESTQSNAALQYSAFTERIPPEGTPVRLVLVPIPLPSDQPAEEADESGKADPGQAPEDGLLE